MQKKEINNNAKKGKQRIMKKRKTYKKRKQIKTKKGNRK